MKYRAKPTKILHTFEINRKPMSLDHRDYLRTIHDGFHPRMLLKTGRQVEKSTTIAVKFLTYSMLIPGFQSVYVVPRIDQAKVFSSQKLDAFIKTSKVLQKYFVSHKVKQNKFQKEFENGSIIWLRSAYLTPDAIRGLTADLLGIDEVQDILTDSIPVMLEILSHSNYEYVLMAGTPKTLEAPIETYWQESSMGEWAVKCSHCGKWNVMGDDCEKNIDKTGLVCRYCGKPLDLHNDKQQWVWTGDPDSYFHGFHIPQLIVPWIKWDKIWHKYTSRTYSRALFYNEVLGLSYAISDRPLQEKDVREICTGGKMQTERTTYHTPFFMGIDWATTSGQHFDEAKKGFKKKSYTVVVIGYIDNMGKIHVVYMHRYQGQEADNSEEILQDIIRLIKKYKITFVGADWGVGSGGFNPRIRNYFLADSGEDRIIECYYSAKLAAYSRWDPAGRKYILNRTSHMTRLFRRIQERTIQFPDWEYSETYMKDFLSIYNAVDQQQRLYYDHEAKSPDDTVHATVFMLAAMEHYFGTMSQSQPVEERLTFDTDDYSEYDEFGEEY